MFLLLDGMPMNKKFPFFFQFQIDICVHIFCCGSKKIQKKKEMSVVLPKQIEEFIRGEAAREKRLIRALDNAEKRGDIYDANVYRQALQECRKNIATALKVFPAGSKKID